MNTPSSSKFELITPVMNAITIGGAAVACAVIIALSGIPGLTA